MQLRPAALLTASANLMAFRPSASLTDEVLCAELKAAAHKYGIKGVLPVMEEAVERGAGAPVLRAGVAFLVRHFGTEAVATALRPLSKFIPGLGTAVEIGLFLRGESVAAGESTAIRNRERNAHVKKGLEQLFSPRAAVSAQGASLLRDWDVSEAEIRRMRQTGKVPPAYAFLVPDLQTRPLPTPRPEQKRMSPQQHLVALVEAPWRPVLPPEIRPERPAPQPTAQQRQLTQEQAQRTQEALGQLPSQRAAVLDRGAAALRSRLNERIHALGVADPGQANAGQLAAAVADLGDKLSQLKGWWSSRPRKAEAIDVSLFGGAALRLRPTDLRNAIDGLEAVVARLQQAQSQLATPPEIQLPDRNATLAGQAAADRRQRIFQEAVDKGQAAYRHYEDLLQRGRPAALALEEATRSLSPDARLVFEHEQSRQALPQGGGSVSSTAPGPSTERGNRLLQGIAKTLEAAGEIADRIFELLTLTLADMADIRAALPEAVRQSDEVVWALEARGWPKAGTTAVRPGPPLPEPDQRAALLLGDIDWNRRKAAVFKVLDAIRRVASRSDFSVLSAALAPDIRQHPAVQQALDARATQLRAGELVKAEPTPNDHLVEVSPYLPALAPDATRQRWESVWAVYKQKHPDRAARIDAAMQGTGISPADVMWVAEHAHIDPQTIARRMFNGELGYEALPRMGADQQAIERGIAWQQLRRQDPARAHQIVAALEGTHVDPQVVNQKVTSQGARSLDALQVARAIGAYAPEQLGSSEGWFEQWSRYAKRAPEEAALLLTKMKGTALTKEDLMRIASCTRLTPARAFELLQQITPLFPKIFAPRGQHHRVLGLGHQAAVSWGDMMNTLDPVSSPTGWTRKMLTFTVPMASVWWSLGGSQAKESSTISLYRDGSGHLRGEQFNLPLWQDSSGVVFIRDTGGRMTPLQEAFNRDPGGRGVLVREKPATSMSRSQHADRFSDVLPRTQGEQSEVEAVDKQGMSVEFTVRWVNGKPAARGYWQSPKRHDQEFFEFHYDRQGRLQQPLRSDRSVDEDDLAQLSPFRFERKTVSMKRTPVLEIERLATTSAGSSVKPAELLKLQPNVVVRVQAATLQDVVQALVSAMKADERASQTIDLTVAVQARNGQVQDLRLDISKYNSDVYLINYCHINNELIAMFTSTDGVKNAYATPSIATTPFDLIHMRLNERGRDASE